MTTAEFKATLSKISKASEEISECIKKIYDALDDPLDYDICDYLIEDIYGLIPSATVQPYTTVDKLMESYGELFEEDNNI